MPAKKEEAEAVGETSAALAQGGPPPADVPEYPRRVASDPESVTLEVDSEEEANQLASAGRPLEGPTQWQNGWRVRLAEPS